MKRRRKVSSGARVSERYDRPQSPAQRLLAWPDPSDDKPKQLQEMTETRNPFVLARQVRRDLQAIRILLRQARRHVA
jgi:hypothetical protein